MGQAESHTHTTRTRRTCGQPAVGVSHFVLLCFTCQPHLCISPVRVVVPYMTHVVHAVVLCTRQLNACLCCTQPAVAVDEQQLLGLPHATGADTLWQVASPLWGPAQAAILGPVVCVFGGASHARAVPGGRGDQQQHRAVHVDWDFSCSRVGHGCVAAAVKSAGAVLAAAAEPGGCASSVHVAAVLACRVRFLSVWGCMYLDVAGNPAVLRAVLRPTPAGTSASRSPHSCVC